MQRGKAWFAGFVPISLNNVLLKQIHLNFALISKNKQKWKFYQNSFFSVVSCIYTSSSSGRSLTFRALENFLERKGKKTMARGWVYFILI